ncbi:MAG: iron ABC transporter permease [Treponemataceae bacterium]|nr:iron ABC transporter permease [Treponemataceae bacterium]
MNQRKRFTVAFILMFCILLFLFIWNLSTGSVSLSLKEIVSILLGDDSSLTHYRVIWDIRLPRLIAAVLLGGALSVSGFLLQTFFGNPIAGPYVLGISSGAKLLVALTMIFFLGQGLPFSSMGMVLAAFFGSMISMGIVLLLSTKVRNMSVLVVCGIMIGYICSAITDFAVTFASDSNIVNLHNWSMGSLSGMNWQDVKIMTGIVLLVTLLTFFLSKPISAYQLGENYARNMGVNIKLLRTVLILFSSLLSACVTAFAGPISFVGIAVPHLVKTASGTAKPLILIPGCFLGGAIITVLCDCIARMVFAPTEISISSVTAVLLVPVVVYMMMKKQGRRS